MVIDCVGPNPTWKRWQSLVVFCPLTLCSNLGHWSHWTPLVAYNDVKVVGWINHLFYFRCSVGWSLIPMSNTYFIKELYLLTTISQYHLIKGLRLIGYRRSSLNSIGMNIVTNVGERWNAGLTYHITLFH